MKRFNLVTGARNSGKTAFLSSLAEQIDSDGILTLSEDASKKSLWVHFIKSGSSQLLMHRKSEGEAYLLESETFRCVNEYLMQSNSSVVIIDEIGAIELDKQQGFYESLLFLLKRTELKLYISVRDTNLGKLEALIKRECPAANTNEDIDVIRL